MLKREVEAELERAKGVLQRIAEGKDGFLAAYYQQIAKDYFAENTGTNPRKPSGDSDKI